MHHFVYPSEDTYISNRNEMDTKNFGIDEILQIGTSNTVVRTLKSTKDYIYTDQIFNNNSTINFTGRFTGSFVGTISASYGTVSGSGLVFSASYFSGSVNGVDVEGSGSFGTLPGSDISGSISGSIISPYSLGIFIGQLTGSVCCFLGTGSGTDIRNENNWTTSPAQYVDRALIKFDLSVISQSIVNAEIINPKFYLNVKICNEYDLPITYKVYALPISQSWNMGDGYADNGGTDTGVSWRYRDNNDGIPWYTTYITDPRMSIDFISTPSLVSASFGFGGGTWHTTSYCSQSFNYQSSDICMDVTPIVRLWLSGTVPNQGILLIHSDELQSTGSGFILKFFSKDTNTIYSPYLDVGWDDSVFTTSSAFTTSSVTIITINSGITASVQSGSSFVIAGGINGSFSSSALLTFTENYSASVLLNDLSASGLVDGMGLTGNIIDLPVFGNVSGIVSVSSSTIVGECGNSSSVQFATASFIDGRFSGSTFTAYYENYKFVNAILTGSWTSVSLLGASVLIPIPSGVDPYVYAYVSGDYINGRALGTYVIFNSTSASFNGNFIDGNLLGGNLTLQLSGSVYTSSFSYTSSVEFTSSTLTALDIQRPFTINIQNLQPTYKAGDIVKIGVFGRKKFPLKYFGKSTQQEQYLIPEFLPSSSYYAIRDNQTDEIVMNFDEYTKLSCEYPGGNYFIVDTTGLQQERYYNILIRVVDSANIYTIDTGKIFKIIR